MPLTTLHLVALSPGKTANQFLRALKSQSIRPLVASKVIRWIIKPEKLSTNLLNQQWDLLVILPVTTPLPETYLNTDWVVRHWSITAGVPKSLLHDFHSKNKSLLSSAGPPLSRQDNKLMASSSQDLELSPDLLEWSKTFNPGAPVSMLNLLSFHPGKDAHESYLKYGKAFAESIGKNRGGNAKIVGKVVAGQGTRDEDRYGWDEVALAQYPSAEHFVDMLGSEDYQSVNKKFRVPALRDTLILCTCEAEKDVESVWDGDSKGPKL